jgi:hypothetical protein
LLEKGVSQARFAGSNLIFLLASRSRSKMQLFYPKRQVKHGRAPMNISNSVKDSNADEYVTEGAVVVGRDRSCLVRPLKDSSAALLLLQVGKIAVDEIVQMSTLTVNSVGERNSTFGSVVETYILPSSDYNPLTSGSFKQKRCRTVSIEDIVSSYRIALHEATDDSINQDCYAHESSSEDEDDDEEDDDQASTKSTETLSKVLATASSRPKKQKHALVGTTTTAPARAVLRKKFSWKSFPVLEQYLVRHRAKYLSFSAAHNYTRQQKTYNNALTQGLLDLAAEKGYVFEGFTFAMVRDRIRCYYKSFVQATKKEKGKKKRASK